MKKITTIILLILSFNLSAKEDIQTGKNDTNIILPNLPCPAFDHVLLDDALITFVELQNMYVNGDILVESIESVEILKYANDLHCSFLKCTLVVKTIPRLEYDVEVMSAGYDVFLATQSPKEFYSLQTLRSKNRSAVTEWNLRYQNPIQNNPEVYGSFIDYDNNYNYGLDFEYKLYMFFQYMEKEFNVKLA